MKKCQTVSERITPPDSDKKENVLQAEIPSSSATATHTVDDSEENGCKVSTPSKIDILCGKDKACVIHEGSKHFRAVIDTYHERYQQCETKQEKMDITREIVETLQSKYGSRFLKFDTKSNLWQEISQMAARDKVSHALRFASQKQERQERRQIKKKLKMKKRSSATSVTSSASSAVSVMSEVGTKSTTPVTPDTTAARGFPKQRRASDPLPFANEEDAKLWEKFVKRQQRLLTSIQKGELPPPPPLNEVSVETTTINENDIVNSIPLENPNYLAVIMQEPLRDWVDDDSDSF